MGELGQLSVDIEADVVELKKDLKIARAAIKQFADRAKRDVSTTNRSFIDLERGIQSTGRGIKAQLSSTARSVRKSLSSISIGVRKTVKETATAKKTMSSMQGAVLGIFSVAGVQQLLSTATALEKIDRGFKVVSGSAKEAAEDLMWVRKLSRELGLDFVQAATGFSQFSVATKGTALEGEKTRKIFRAVSKAATAMGLSADDTNGVFRAMTQIVSKGKVQAEELRGQLGERLPGAFQIAARAMNMTTMQLDKFMSTGKLTAEMLLPAMADEMEKTFGASAQEGMEGTRAKLNRLKNAFFEVKEAMLKVGATDSMDWAMGKTKLWLTYLKDGLDTLNKISKGPKQKPKDEGMVPKADFRDFDKLLKENKAKQDEAIKEKEIFWKKMDKVQENINKLESTGRRDTGLVQARKQHRNAVMDAIDSINKLKREQKELQDAQASHNAFMRSKQPGALNIEKMLGLDKDIAASVKDQQIADKVIPVFQAEMDKIQKEMLKSGMAFGGRGGLFALDLDAFATEGVSEFAKVTKAQNKELDATKNKLKSIATMYASPISKLEQQLTFVQNIKGQVDARGVLLMEEVTRLELIADIKGKILDIDKGITKETDNQAKSIINSYRTQKEILDSQIEILNRSRGRKDKEGKLLHTDEELDETVRRVKAAQDEIKTGANSLTQDLEAGIKEWGQAFGSEMTEMVKAGELSFAKIRDSFMDMIATTLMNNLFQSVIGGAMGSLFPGMPKGKADGGYARGMTMVGERGPELVDLGRSGAYVHTARKTESMLSKKGESGLQVNFGGITFTGAETGNKDQATQFANEFSQRVVAVVSDAKRRGQL